MGAFGSLLGFGLGLWLILCKGGKLGARLSPASPAPPS